jgi:dihydroorotate dehydrogenase electron transfer subunit
VEKGIEVNDKALLSILKKKSINVQLMMSKVVKIATSKEMFVQASLERMMKCGVGICGSCCVNDDLVCKDGTIFDGKHLLSKSEFGHSHRNKAGILEVY